MGRKRRELDGPSNGQDDPSGNPKKRREDVPLVVQKVWGALKARGMMNNHVEDQVGLTQYTIYRWGTSSGQPTAGECVRLSQVLDLSLDYLIDDGVSLADPPPRRIDTGAISLVRLAKDLSIDMDVVKQYLCEVRMLINLDISPVQLTRIIADVMAERRQAGVTTNPRSTGDQPSRTNGGSGGGANGNQGRSGTA